MKQIYWCIFFVLTRALFLQAQVVSPEGSGVAEGNSASSAPFNQTGVRYQQIYGASDFQFSPPGWIIGLSFRVDGAGMSFVGSTLSNVQINLSTTARQPDSLSPVFQENIGINQTVVRTGALTISGSDVHIPGEGNPFDVGVALTTPYFYDPAQGNLLLDVRNFMGAATSPFDAVNVAGDSVSSLSAIGANSASGTPSSLGLVTFFSIQSVPEPSTWTLLVVGLAVLWIVPRRWRR